MAKFNQAMKPIPLLIALLLLSAAVPESDAGQGGGYTLGGPLGRYYANTNLSGSGGFTRRDVRLDFALNNLPPGGAGRFGDLAFRSVPAAGFSVQWSGKIMPRFSETYTFTANARDSFRLQLRATGSQTWTTVIDQWTYTGTTTSGSYAMTAGSSYDVQITFVHADGPWAAQLRWASPSTPDEVIDPIVEAGINNPDWTAGFADIVKGARNSWEPVNGGPRPAMDTNGWPMGDGAYVFQESLNQGLDIDPLMRGLVSFSFQGIAKVTIQGNVRGSSLSYQYDASRNLTTGSFFATNNGWNASYINFTGTHRDGATNGPGGITEFHLMRPVAPGELVSSVSSNSLFTTELLNAMSHFTVIRHQYVANQQRDWSERTRPGFFNQSGGAINAAHYGIGDPSNNGASWEIKVLLANESGRDLMISLPTVASGTTPQDTSSYIWKLANLIRYGSDGSEPYTAPVADPVYPPLNPNLRVYLELENELWNWGGVFYVDWANINALLTADITANNADFQAINFDNLSTARDSNGNYTSLNTWRFRKIILRLFQISDIFRSVWGDDNMMTHIRPLYEWQYANDNDTARLALTFADRYFNNGDGQQHVANPHPVNHWLWGGGGATYYGAVNGNGLTDFLPDPSFSIPALSVAGYQAAPAGSIWAFSGTAGVARDGGSADDIPPAFKGSQMGYITDKGSASISVTFPGNFISPTFGVSFKALNRYPNGATNANRENLRVYLDKTNDITARTFSQGNGYTASSYDASYPWSANNVFWTHSEYYSTRSFSVAPGSTHTITFQGMGDISTPANINQTVFLGEVRVTSVDRIFAGGMPGGGEATGQPVGQNIQNTMNVEATWAKAFGLEQLSYESGWSLGGDDGGSWVQLAAKYGDNRTAGVQGRFMDMFHLAGSAVNVFGTYAQWPSWSDFYARQGLLDVTQYPIVMGIDDRSSRLRPEPINGLLAPVVLAPSSVTISDHSDSAGRINAAGGWLNWNLIAPVSGNYSLSLSSAGANIAGAVMLLDDQSMGAIGQLPASAFLSKGLHSVKVRSISNAVFQVQNVTVAMPGAPASPVWSSVMDGDGQATLSWAPVPGATGCQVRYGSAPGMYTQTLDVGTASSLVVSGLTNNQQWFFVVLAGNASGLSLPSAEKGVIPLGASQPGSLAIWEFQGALGNESNAVASSASARIALSPLHRGAGLTPSTSSWAATLRLNRYASEASDYVYGTNLAQSIAKKQYYEFTVQAAAGQKISISQLAFRAYFQNSVGGAGITCSADGANFNSQLIAVGSPASAQAPWIVNLTNAPSLQNTAALITFRIYLYGLGAYQVSGLGDASGSDVVLTGSIASTRVSLMIAPAGSGTIQLSWPTNGLNYKLNRKDKLDPASSWNVISNAPQLLGSNWTLELPIADTNDQFFQLIY